MGWVSGIATFVVIWWTALFAVLPFGVERDAGTGQVGAPKKPMMGRKVVATTLISMVLWSVVYMVVSSPYVSFRQMAKEMPLE